MNDLGPCQNDYYYTVRLMNIISWQIILCTFKRFVSFLVLDVAFAFEIDVVIVIDYVSFYYCY